MKANKFFLGLALIGAILTGCETGQGPETNGDEAKAYMSVRISMASTAGSRASDAGFEAGTTAEQTINVGNSIFLFYDEDGNWVTSGQLATGDAVYEDGDCDVATLSNTGAYIVLSGPDVELQKSEQVLTVVNFNGVDKLKQLNLNEALLEVANSTDNKADGTTCGFLMSTSVYYDKALDDANNKLYPNGIVNTTAIDASKNICQTATAAKDNPVVIHIERASAKAQLSTASGDYLLTGDKQVVVDGVLSDVTVAINGWTLNNVHETTYLVKRLQEGWATSAPFTTWNWTEGRRSYWAEGCNWGKLTNAGNTVYAYENATLLPDGTASMYCYENTVNQPKCAKGEPTPNVNTVLIAAQFKVGTEDYQNLYEYAGVFYREGTYKALLVKQLNDAKYRKNDAELTASDITIDTVGTTLAGVKIILADGSYTVNGAPSSKADADTYINATSYVDETKGYAMGKCFYQIPVEHLGAVGTSAEYGMVRNHVYKISIKSVNHVGEPVYDPTVDIPEIPAQTIEHYLAAEIHVLDWHVVEQSVDL